MKNIQTRFNLEWPNFNLSVDVDIPSRGVTAIFGHSGSGKTTFLRLIAGLEKVEKGYLSFKGEVWQDEKTFLPTHKRPLGYVFQEASLFSHLTVYDNLRYGQKRVSTKHKQMSLDHAIDLLGIQCLLERKPEKLSGGERQRVAIARALAVEPKLLLMDEPLASLDLKRKQEILPYLQKLHDELEIPILYVSHSPEEVSRLADYLVVMKDGGIIASGTLSETLTQTSLPIRLGEEIGTVLEGTLAEIDQNWNLARVDFSGGKLWTPDHQITLGNKVRVRILARDVSLAKKQPEQTSIQNQLSGYITAITDDEHQGLSLVYVKVGNSYFIARLTKRAVASLSLSVNEKVWIQIKTVSLIE